MFFLTRNIIILPKSFNLQKIISMKSAFLSIGFCFGVSLSLAQTNFQNIWKNHNSTNQIEIKINSTPSSPDLSFVLEGLVNKTSRIFITGPLSLKGVNEYTYQDQYTNCALTFNFINKDSMYIESQRCDLYTLKDSVDGLFTSNFDELITPKLFGTYIESKEKAIEQTTGEDFETIKLKSVHKNTLEKDSVTIVFMAGTDEMATKDPEVVYYIKDDSISIFHRYKDVINSFTNPIHKDFGPEISEWLKKERVAPEVKQ